MVTKDQLEEILTNTGDELIVCYFWTTSCESCATEMKFFDKLQDEYADEDVRVILINLNAFEDKGKVTTYIPIDAQRPFSVAEMTTTRAPHPWNCKASIPPKLNLINKELFTCIAPHMGRWNVIQVFYDVQDASTKEAIYFC